MRPAAEIGAVLGGPDAVCAGPQVEDELDGVSRRTARCQHQLLGLHQGNRAEEPHLVHAWRLGHLRLGTYIPIPGIDPAILHDIFCAQCRRHPRHVRHVFGRRARAHDHLRPQHHAVHLGLDHHPAVDRGFADPRSAEEGGRERAQETEPIHALRHGAAGGGAGLRNCGRDRGHARRRRNGGARTRGSVFCWSPP